MKTASYADSSSQLSERFMLELTLQGVEANNLAACNKLPSPIGKPSSTLDLPSDYFYLQDEEGDTQLHIAIALDRSELSSLLISIAPSPSYLDIANDESLTALHCAALYGQYRIVRKLVLAGADTQVRTSEGDTALHLAVKQGHLGCIKALITPLTVDERELLTKSNNPRPLPQLPVHLDARNYVGISPLHFAASKNDVQIVHELLVAGAHVNIQEGLAGRTPLHMAIERDNAEVVHYLAQIPTTLVATTYSGDAAYQMAVECRPRYVEALLSYGASPVIHTHDDESMSEDDSCDDDYEVLPYVGFKDSYSNKANTATLLIV